MDASRKIGKFRASERGIKVPTELIPDVPTPFLRHVCVSHICLSTFAVSSISRILLVLLIYILFSALYSTVPPIAELAAPDQIGYPASQISP